MFHLTDEFEVEHVVNPKNTIFKLGFEATVMRVYKHDGKVYHSTHRRLDASRSRWGASITFGDMYVQLGGPSNDVLFDEKKAYSPFCHIFLMVHPDILIATKANVGTGYLVYLGPKKMWNIDSSPYPLEQVDTVVHLPVGTTELPVAPPKPVLLQSN